MSPARSAPALASALTLALLGGCYPVRLPAEGGITSFAVQVEGVYLPETATTPRRPLGVVTRCAQQYGGDANVPPDVRGKGVTCPYLMPYGEVELDLEAVALGPLGPETDFNGPVSFRIVPGDLTGDYTARWSHAYDGVAKLTLKAAHLFGEVRAWAEDAPPVPVFASGQLSGTIDQVLRIPIDKTEIVRLESDVGGTKLEHLQLSYFKGPDLVLRVKVSLEGLTLANGRTISLGGEVRPGTPRTEVSRVVASEPHRDFPPVYRGELYLSTGTNPLEPTAGNFTLTFANQGDLAGRTVEGTFSGGLGAREQLPVEPERRTYASGLSPIIYVEEPTVAKVQRPDGFDNRTSPLIGQFLTIGKGPDSGLTLLQSCEDDSANDGQPAMMVVTGTDPGGFFVTDLTACRLKEQLTDPITGQSMVRVPEPSGYLPGTFGSMFIYNYSFPEGLDPGDLLFTLSGAVQEFTSTTQLTFPSWTIAEKVRQLPQEQWDKWLGLVKPVELNLRHCGLDNPYITDTMCGHSRTNLKLESLESSLVKVRRVKFPQVFAPCDEDGDGEVPFFCDGLLAATGCPAACVDQTPYCNAVTGSCQAANRGWRDCNFDGPSNEPEALVRERNCNIACATGQGPYEGELCAERATFVGFGQFIVELAGPGPAAAGLDDSLPQRMQQVAISSTPAKVSYGPGTELRVFCDTAVRVNFSDGTVNPGPADTLLPEDTLLEHRFDAAAPTIGLVADSDFTSTSHCVVAPNTHTRINLVTKDAIPELEPDCLTDDPDPEAAEQCRALRGARFDVVGHLRHLQPGRPRWVVMPRDVDDVCCWPGPGLSCPKPIKPCTGG